LNDYNEAQSLFGEINSSFRYYRLSQWARCIALLHLGRLKEAELALSMPDEAGQSSEWPIPRSLASEILRLCGERQAPETISRVVYDEIRPDFKAEPEQWTDFFERAAVNHGHAFDRLLRDVQEAIDRAFNDALADALIDRLVTVAEICAEDLGRLRTIAPGLAETLQLIGRSDNAEVLLEKMLRSGPRADLIDVFTSYVSILRSANQANKAEDKIAEWHQALHAAGDDVRRRLSDLSGTISVDDAETNAARVIRATRIAIFGGHPRQRETCTAVLTKMGFAPKDISWLDANAGNGLTYSDCIDLINGTYDCYVVVTTRIGHATSLPIVFALKKKSAKWAPLGIYGYQNFEIQIREQMRAWDLLE
jgi:tetratricopeptide (TPR) repeat protein